MTCSYQPFAGSAIMRVGGLYGGLKHVASYAVRRLAPPSVNGRAIAYGASTPTPIGFADHLSPGRRGRGSQAGKALALRQRISSPPSIGGEVAREAGRSGGRCTLKGLYAIALPLTEGRRERSRSGNPGSHQARYAYRPEGPMRGTLSNENP